MDRFLDKLKDAKQHLAEPAWDDARARAVLLRVQQARTPRSQVPRWLPFAMAPALAAVLVWLAFVAKGPAVPTTLVMHDGSRALPLTPLTRLHLVDDEPTSALLDLEQGHGRFEVVPNRARRFRVVSGAYSVEALGTVFTVNRLAAGGVHVAVLIGHVMVRWPGGEYELWQGQEQRFPLSFVASPPVAAAVNASKEQKEASDPALLAAPSAPLASQPKRASSQIADWRQLARQKSFARAFEVMRASGVEAVRDVPQELLLAADVARRAGHPEVATKHLSRILQAHRSDPRASVAAFTLGRVYAQQGQSPAAAETFEKAFALEPKGALAENALARAAFAWKASGNQGRMRAAAANYQRYFPNGHQAEALGRLVSVP